MFTRFLKELCFAKKEEDTIFWKYILQRVETHRSAFGSTNLILDRILCYMLGCLWTISNRSWKIKKCNECSIVHKDRMKQEKRNEETKEQIERKQKLKKNTLRYFSGSDLCAWRANKATIVCVISACTCVCMYVCITRPCVLYRK